GVKMDCHQACFVQFIAEGKEIPPPTQIEPGHVLLPLYGQIPPEINCVETLDYAIRHRTPPFYHEAFITSQILAVLYQMSISLQKIHLWTKRDNAKAYQILKFIDDNLDKKLSEREYSEVFGKSYRQLNTIFYLVYGMTIKKMQGNLRIGRAKRMLSSGYSIKNTAMACGFDDYLYFLKVFKMKTGLTPSEYADQFDVGQKS
ncbi:MAG: helix-turn-helix transcriptional regulator, partial [Clostridia bacterium]|nr:helix-turn-helix transcriptional regulator [Clostridia bacterium]